MKSRVYEKFLGEKHMPTTATKTFRRNNIPPPSRTVKVN